MTPLAALSPNSDFVTACYIVAFSLFIFGIQQGTHPRTARRGNLIAAAGMLVAVAVTLCDFLTVWVACTIEPATRTAAKPSITLRVIGTSVCELWLICKKPAPHAPSSAIRNLVAGQGRHDGSWGSPQTQAATCQYTRLSRGNASSLRSF